MYGSSAIVWDPILRLDRAEYYLKQTSSLGKFPNAHVLSSFAVLTALRSKPEQSLEFWKQAFETDAKTASIRFDNVSAQQVMKRVGIADAVAELEEEYSH